MKLISMHEWCGFSKSDCGCDEKKNTDSEYDLICRLESVTK